MGEYKLEQRKQTRISRLVGAGLAIFVSGVLVTYLILNGLYPTASESSDTKIVVDVDNIEIEEPQPPKKKPKQHISGTKPTVANPNPEEEVNLVEQTKSPIQGTKENITKEATRDEFGDVKTPVPPRDSIKQTALFPGSLNQSNEVATTPHTALEPTEAIKDGHVDGNIQEGDQAGRPNARLAGRTVIGALPLPSYNVPESGKVVVKIKVNRDGTVVEALPGDAGTTLTNKTAWEAAKKAALKTQFNMKSDAAEFQYGTITYIFNITK